jgi:hypothetical protein
VERGRVEMVFRMAEAALPLGRKLKVAVPVVRWLAQGVCRKEMERRRAWKRRHADAARDGLNLHLPAVRARGRVVIAIVHQNFDGQLNRPFATRQIVTKPGCVGVFLHPQALLDQSFTQREGPDGRRSFQMEALDEAETLRVNRAIGPAVRAEREGLGTVFRDFVHLGDEQDAPHRRLERGHQQSVIAAGQRAGDGARGESAQAVRHQPLTSLSGFEDAADFAAKINGRNWRVGHRLPI